MAELATTDAQLHSRKRFKIELGFVLCTLMLGLLILIVVYPLSLLLFNSFVVDLPGGGKEIGFGNWTMAWSTGGIVQSVINTFYRVFFTILISFPVAILFTWLLTRTDIPGRNMLDFMMWMSFFLPTLPILMGWILLADPDFGVLNALIAGMVGTEKGPFNIYSFWGIVFAHIVIRSVASKYIFMAPAFRNMDSSMEEASRISGFSSLGTLMRIVVPVMAPAILITFIISTIHTLESFEVEQVLGPPIGFYVFSTKIYQVINSETPMFGVATVLSMAILLTMIPLILIQQWITGKRNFTTVTSHFKRNVIRLGFMRWPAFVLVFGFMVMTTVIPLVFLIMGTFMNLFGFFNIETVWSLRHWNRVLNDPILVNAIWNTIKLAGGAAFVGMLLYTILAYISVRTRYVGRSAIDFLTWLPASIPGIILGLGMLWMFLNVPLFRPMYGTIIILIIAVIINSMTTGVQLIKSNMVQLGRELEEASSISGGSWSYTFRKIVLPILAPVLLTIGTLTFASASRNVANIAMIVTGNNRPLSMLQLDYMADGNYESAAITGVFVVVLTVGVVFISRMIGRRIGIRS